MSHLTDVIHYGRDLLDASQTYDIQKQHSAMRLMLFGVSRVSIECMVDLIEAKQKVRQKLAQRYVEVLEEVESPDLLLQIDAQISRMYDQEKRLVLDLMQVIDVQSLEEQLMGKEVTKTLPTSSVVDPEFALRLLKVCTEKLIHAQPDPVCVPPQ